MSDIGEKVLNILEKLEKQVKTSKEALEKYKDMNIDESPQMQKYWNRDVMNEYDSLKNIITEIKESLGYWATEQMKKRTT